MKTDELISLLAAGDTTVEKHALSWRFAVALCSGLFGAFLLMAALYGVRADLGDVMRLPLFWAKVALPASLAILALWLCSRLARPGVRGGAIWWALALTVSLVWLGSLAVLAWAPVGARAELILGHTWRTCPLNIALLAVPAFISVFWALRGLAPTCPRQAGAGGGLLAGATGTLAYTLHCPEMAVPFWGVWYVLGMLLPLVAGSVLGRRVLQW